MGMENKNHAGPGRRSRRVRSVLALVLLLFLVQPARAVDPPYQQEMQRLLEIIGNLYFLQPLCGFEQENWRQNAQELIELDEPGDERKQRLTGAFNQGYQAYARLYRSCTPSANQAMIRLLGGAGHLARDIQSRYGE